MSFSASGRMIPILHPGVSVMSKFLSLLVTALHDSARCDEKCGVEATKSWRLAGYPQSSAFSTYRLVRDGALDSANNFPMRP